MINVKDLFKWFKDVSYNMLKVGRSLPIAGLTGSMAKSKFIMQSNVDKSKRVMRTERGSLPDEVGARRIYRTAQRMLKQWN